MTPTGTQLLGLVHFVPCFCAVSTMIAAACYNAVLYRCVTQCAPTSIPQQVSHGLMLSAHNVPSKPIDTCTTRHPHTDSTSAAAGSSCLLALQALDLCLFSEALTAMTTVRQLRNQLLSLVYRVSWSVTRPIKLAEGYLRVPWHPDACGRSDSSSDETSEDNEVAAATGDAPHEQSSEEQVDC